MMSNDFFNSSMFWSEEARRAMIQSQFAMHNASLSDCWFCDCPGETTIEEKLSYSFDNGSSVTTFTRTIPIVVCNECKKKIKHDDIVDWLIIGLSVILATSIIWLLWTILNKTGLDYFQNIGITIVSLGFSAGLFALSAFVFYRVVTRKFVTFYKKDFKRQLDEHPLVIQARKEGFS